METPAGGGSAFRVDLTLMPKTGIAQGILCDSVARAPAADPIQWDLFRCGILNLAGWDLTRIYSPDIFRDPRRQFANLRPVKD